MVRPMSMASASISTARAASLMRSEALGPQMVTPSTRSSLESRTTFTKPSVFIWVMARPLAAQGNLPTLTSKPSALASCSCRPAVATSGSVKTTAGTVRASL